MNRLAAIALFASACAGPSIEPLRPDGGPPTDAGPLDCTDEVALQARLLEPRCGASDCHDDVRPSAGLDLVSPEPGARIVGMTSVHEDCEGEPLVVPGVAPASFLMDKVLGTHGSCGDPMPSATTALSIEERRCLAAWITSLQP